MFIHYRTQGFILKKNDRGEFDQLLTIYTKDFGKLEILARAVRKISSKLSAGVGLFYLSEIEFIQGKAYKTLTDAILIAKFDNLRKSLNRLKLAYKMAESLTDLVHGQEKDEKIWDLLKETFQKLNDRSLATIHRSLVYYYFLWDLLAILGYQPELYHCINCHQKLTAGQLFFGLKEGGLICQKCEKLLKLGKETQPKRKEFLLAIDLETIKILRIILKKDWSLLTKLKIDKTDLKSLREITDEYYSYIRGELTLL